MATLTALDLITQSLKRLGVISGIETPSADLAQDGLARLNDLIETWSTENLSLWAQGVLGGEIPSAFPPGQFTYTIGPGGTVDVPTRPAWIDVIGWVHRNTTPWTETRLTQYSRQQWELEPAKLLTGLQSTHFTYLTTWPLGYLHMWPIPTATFYLWIYVPQPWSGPATLATTFSLPPGYSRALRDWLAIELAPEVGRPVDGTLVQTATDAKAQIQRVNFRPRVLWNAG